MLVAYVLPASFYLRIRAHKPWRAKKALSLLILLGGMAMLMSGIAAAAQAAGGGLRR